MVVVVGGGSVVVGACVLGGEVVGGGGAVVGEVVGGVTACAEVGVGAEEAGASAVSVCSSAVFSRAGAEEAEEAVCGAADVSATGVASPESPLPPQAAAKIARAAKANNVLAIIFEEKSWFGC